MELQSVEPSLVSVKAILLLDNDGKRVFSKYYDDTFPSLKEQQKFEETLFNKTHRANAEIVMLEGTTCVYRSNVDLYFYVVGSQIENEQLQFLRALWSSMSKLAQWLKGVQSSSAGAVKALVGLLVPQATSNTDKRVASAILTEKYYFTSWSTM
ncbi:coatomer subunit zeta-1-like isoform X2 [Dysidea avara]|uniref:coatomer subunit zeta-1-like isoform X2 n=1 Tax=Dysidea avara TaxID=196820 RepID=UPI0033224F59